MKKLIGMSNPRLKTDVEHARLDGSVFRHGLTRIAFTPLGI